jgi:hypothetical protein
MYLKINEQTINHLLYNSYKPNGNTCKRKNRTNVSKFPLGSLHHINNFKTIDNAQMMIERNDNTQRTG